MNAKYLSSGTAGGIISLGQSSGMNGLVTWSSSTPASTSVKFQTRSSANGVTGWSDWSSYYTDSDGENIVSPSNSYLEYRATLSTGNPNVTPQLHDVSFDYGAKSGPAKENVYNYPNPFSPNDGPTNLAFSVSQSGSVSLVILSGAGREVWRRDMSAGEVLAGKNVVSWDGKDASGLLVPNGVYLYVVEAEGEKVINKIAVVR
jgi:hypothetical protein